MSDAGTSDCLMCGHPEREHWDGSCHVCSWWAYNGRVEVERLPRAAGGTEQE